MNNKLIRLSVAVSVLLMSTLVASAQVKKSGDKEPEPKSYVFCYALVGLGVGLGLISVCRPGNRRREIRRPD